MSETNTFATAGAVMLAKNRWKNKAALTREKKERYSSAREFFSNKLFGLQSDVRVDVATKDDTRKTNGGTKNAINEITMGQDAEADGSAAQAAGGDAWRDVGGDGAWQDAEDDGSAWQDAEGDNSAGLDLGGEGAGGDDDAWRDVEGDNSADTEIGETERGGAQKDGEKIAERNDDAENAKSDESLAWSMEKLHKTIIDGPRRTMKISESVIVLYESMHATGDCMPYVVYHKSMGTTTLYLTKFGVLLRCFKGLQLMRMSHIKRWRTEKVNGTRILSFLLYVPPLGEMPSRDVEYSFCFESEQELLHAMDTLHDIVAELCAKAKTNIGAAGRF